MTKFKDNELTTATYANKKWTVSYTTSDRIFVENHNARFIHAVFNAAGDSLITYNWDSHWLLQILDSMVSPLVEVTEGEVADDMFNGPFPYDTYESKSWPYYKAMTMKFTNSTKFDTSITYDVFSNDKSVNPAYGLFMFHYSGNCKIV